MINSQTISDQNNRGWTTFRIALFAAAAWLVFYIIYRYTTQLHTINGYYAFVFPLSTFVAIAGMYLAIKPKSACDCGGGLRTGIGTIAGAWMVVGLICVPSLTQHIINSPASGLFASFQMLAQHVFLSLSVIAFAAFPKRMLALFGLDKLVERHLEKPSEEQVTTS